MWCAKLTRRCPLPFAPRFAFPFAFRFAAAAGICLLASAAYGDDGTAGGMGGSMMTGGFVPPPGNETFTADITSEIQALRRSHADSEQLLHQKPDTTKVAVEDTRPAALKTIMKKLSPKTDFMFDETPLDEFCDWLSTEIGVSVVIDTHALDEEHLDSTTTFSFEAQQMSYHAALHHILAPMDLAFTIKDNVVLVTTRDHSEESQRVQVYSAWDLATSHGDASDYHTLVSCLTNIVAPNSWEDVGGPGSINEYKGMLMISQTHEIHDEIARTLRSLRAFQQLGGSKEADKQSNEKKHTIRRVATQHIDAPCHIAAAMAVRTSFDVNEESLADVVEVMQIDAEIPILFDQTALRDQGIDPDHEIVSLHAKDITKDAGLRLLLDKLDLSYTIDHEAILITTQEVAKEMLSTSVYDCRDLLDNTNPSAVAALNGEFDQLIAALSSSVAVDTWDDVGGSGTMVAYPSRGVLVVSNTEPVHAELHATLEMLLKTRSLPTAKPKMDYSPSTVVVKAYQLTEKFEKAKLQKQLIATLRGLLSDSDNAFDDAHFSIGAAGDKLIISHRTDAHESLGSLLMKLAAIEQPALGIMGGMGGGMMSGGMGAPGMIAPGMGGGGMGAGGMF